ALRRRLLRIVWAPGLVLLGLWYVLLWLYVSGASPTFWFLSLLAALGDASYLDNAILSLGFTPSGVGTAFMLVPAAATLLSLLTALPAPALVAGMLPRRYLSEQAFQREVSTRVTATLMLPPVLIVLALPVTVLLGMPQPWSGLGAGALRSCSPGCGCAGWSRPRSCWASPTPPRCSPPPGSTATSPVAPRQPRRCGRRTAGTCRRTSAPRPSAPPPRCPAPYARSASAPSSPCSGC